MTDDPDRDLFGHPVAISPRTRKAIEVAAEIMQEPPERADYLHAVLCQVGMPRAATEEREFIRESGLVSMKLEAGSLYNGQRFVKQPLPYGSRPRLVMVHISGEAIRTQRREIEIGDSIREFLGRLEIGDNGGPRGGYTMFKKQMMALAACRLTLGMRMDGRAVTINTQPITRFEAWLQPQGGQHTLWPGELQLSQEFFETLAGHAVPLDPRALGVLKDSALALDIYTWLAHRLCRVNGQARLSWRNLRDQFGQEYADPRDFKKAFRHALRRVLSVYSDARVEEEPGGLLLKSSRPPLAKTQVLLTP
jgi:hypothetical protein